MTRPPDEEPSSSPCLMHEFADQLLPPPPLDWPQVRAWRVATRKALLERRAAHAARARRELGTRAKEHLVAAVQWPLDAVLGIYWPIRGEIDVLDIAARHVEAGGVAALPVVTRKNAAVEFWRWQPHVKMTRGFWNIPVPAVADPVRPAVLIVPLVGFDAAGYRLGYGGGYYDRTIAALEPRPRCIGIGYSESVLSTIHPQPHDIPMNFIVTELGAREV